MPVSESKLRTIRRYCDRTYEQINFRLHKQRDADIIKKLKQVPSMMGYLKTLIRKDLEENK